MKVRTWNEMLALNPPPIEYLIESGILSCGGSLQIYGKPETWKSWLALELALALDKGEKWLGLYQCKPARTLLVQTEQVEFMYRDRIVQLSKHLNGNKPTNVYLATDLTLKLDQHFGQAEMRRVVEEIKPDLVIIDNFYHTVTSESDEVKVKYYLEGLDRMREDLGTAFVIIHHSRKEGEDDRGFDESSGSSVFARWCDTIVRVREKDRAKDIYELDFQKTKLARERLGSINFKADREKQRLHIYQEIRLNYEPSTLQEEALQDVALVVFGILAVVTAAAIHNKWRWS